MIKYNLILGSASPRRRELLDTLDIEYELRLIPEIEEKYNSDIPIKEVARFLAEQKANNYISQLKDNDLLITADTLVILGDRIMAKPKDLDEAKEMLNALSSRSHLVITGVCLTTIKKQISFDACSEVSFAKLSQDEINYYVDSYKPTDKAGAYGIQEWIGSVAVESIKGSYFNIMGLPIQKLYQELKKFN